MAYSTIRTAPLPEGMKPCLYCKEAGRRAFTEIIQYHPMKGYYPGMPLQFMVDHWCDTGGPDSTWSDSKRYCHGHGALSGDVTLAGYASRSEVIEAWNQRMTPIIGRLPSFFAWLTMSIKATLSVSP